MGINSVTYGGVFWAHTIYSYSLVLVGIFLIVQMAVRSFRLYRLQAMVTHFGNYPPFAYQRD